MIPGWFNSLCFAAVAVALWVFVLWGPNLA